MIYRGVSVGVLRRSRRVLSLKLGDKGDLQLQCSLSTPLKHITQFLDRHWIWASKQRQKRKQSLKKYPPKKFRRGEGFLYQGQSLKLGYQKTGPGGPVGFGVKARDLTYCWQDLEDLSPPVLKARLIHFYSQTGEQVLRREVKALSSLMQLFPKLVRVGGQKSFWGSCSAEGRVSLNWRLVAAPGEVLRYVIIHELAHLKHLNHSPAFWALVARFCPRYRQHESWLKTHQEALSFLLP